MLPVSSVAALVATEGAFASAVNERTAPNEVPWVLLEMAQ